MWPRLPVSILFCLLNLLGVALSINTVSLWELLKIFSFSSLHTYLVMMRPAQELVPSRYDSCIAQRGEEWRLIPRGDSDREIFDCILLFSLGIWC